jgi:protein-S-isoprenylcysteine O-methyltransferase Ste14
MGRPSSLSRRAFEGLAQFLVALAAFIFLPAWSLRFWQGWLFWGVFSIAVTWITAYFLKRDPALIERRLKAGPGAEKEKTQKFVQALASLIFVALLVLPGIDRRHGWSHLSAAVVLAGDALIALGMLLVFRVFRENSYASGVVEVEREQRVITTGPYRIVRHPMYSGSLLFLWGIPLALGSLWDLLLCLPMTATIVWRLVQEEKYLAVNLPGYADYRNTTRYRLIPRIF